MLPNYHGPDRAGVGWRALAVDNDTPFKRLFSFLRIKPLRSRTGVFVVLGILSLFWFITVQFGPPSFFTDTFPPPPPPPPGRPPPFNPIDDHVHFIPDFEKEDFGPEGWADRADMVKEAFVHAYHGYETHAIPQDELLPLTNRSVNK